eukprot:gene33309-43065_t
MTITFNLVEQSPDSSALSPLRYVMVEDIKRSNSSNELGVLLRLNKTLTSLRIQLLSSISSERLDSNSTEAKTNVIDAVNTSPRTMKPAIVDTALMTEPQQPIRRKPSSYLVGKRAVIFTMDSIESYEKNSLVGGAAGELAVRKSLQRAFTYLSMSFFVAKSDEDFNSCNLNNYDFVILDPWTWAQRGVGPKRFLTAFGSPWNTFLGYFIEPSDLNTGKSLPAKLQQGVIWGKDAKHFEGREKQLQAAARKVRLLSTASTAVFRHDNIQWLALSTSLSPFIPKDFTFEEYIERVKTIFTEL